MREQPEKLHMGFTREKPIRKSTITPSHPVGIKVRRRGGTTTTIHPGCAAEAWAIFIREVAALGDLSLVSVDRLPPPIWSTIPVSIRWIIPTVVTTIPGAVVPTGAISGAVIPTGAISGAVIPTGAISGAVIPTGAISGAVIPRL